MSVDLPRLHGVLKDKTRAKALELLRDNATLSYSELQRLLGIKHTGKLNYHLRVLGDLLDKDETTGRYALSEKGKIAVSLLSRFQTDTMKRPDGILVLGSLMAAVGALQLYDSLSGIADFLSFLDPATCSSSSFFYSLSQERVLEATMLCSGAGLILSRRWARPVAIGALVGVASLNVAWWVWRSTI